MSKLKHNKIIFLDIDGVINIDERKFKKVPQENLVRLLKETGAKIVISSSWRDEDLNYMFNVFRSKGMFEEIISEIIDVTTHGRWFIDDLNKFNFVRGNEIQQWIDDNLKYPWRGSDNINDKEHFYNDLGKDYQYLIIDDDRDMLLTQKDNFQD